MGMKPSWITSKASRYDTPWMKMEYPGIGFVDSRVVIKSWQNDPTQDFARWNMGSVGPGTHGMLEIGDGYVRDVLYGAELVEVNGETPTAEQLDEFAVLCVEVLSGADPMTAMGF